MICQPSNIRRLGQDFALLCLVSVKFLEVKRSLGRLLPVMIQ